MVASVCGEIIHQGGDFPHPEPFPEGNGIRRGSPRRPEGLPATLPGIKNAYAG